MSDFDCDHDRDTWMILEELAELNVDEHPDRFDLAERELANLEAECQKDCAISGTPV